MKKIVDLFCGAGGASKGYADAGFEVVGIDIEPQPHYPYDFIQGDALATDLPNADLYHASPPCQCYSTSTVPMRRRGKQYPDLIAATREKLKKTGRPFVIENVPGAPLRRDLVLCGSMFNLRVIRHRLFEIHGFIASQPPHLQHKGRSTGHLRDFGIAYYYTVVGHGYSTADTKQNWSDAMQINWMNKKELAQAIPPAYTRYIGRRAVTVL